MILQYFLKLKHHKFFSSNEGSFKKKVLPDKLEQLKALQKVFPENSSEISRKFKKKFNRLEIFGWSETVIFSGNMEHFWKIYKINFMKYSCLEGFELKA